jgi:hypothetical protein
LYGTDRLSDFSVSSEFYGSLRANIGYSASDTSFLFHLAHKIYPQLMSKQNQGRFNVAARVGASKTTTPVPVASPDEVLFKPTLQQAEATPAAEQADEEALMRFGSQLFARELITLHRIAYWQRVPLYEVLSEAIRAYGATQPEAANPLPEKERVSRKLPRA